MYTLFHCLTMLVVMYTFSQFFFILPLLPYYASYSFMCSTLTVLDFTVILMSVFHYWPYKSGTSGLHVSCINK